MRRAVISLVLFFAFVVIVTASRHSTSTVTTSTTASPGVGSTSTTTTSVVAPGSTCTGSDFHATFGLSQGAAGTVYSSVRLTKTTTGQCTLNGWPLLTLQNAQGAVVASRTIDLPTSNSPIVFPDTAANAAPTTLTLATGASTSFDLAYSDVPTGSETSCPSVSSVAIAIAQGQAVAVATPSYPLQPCGGGTVWVSPFFKS